MKKTICFNVIIFFLAYILIAPLSAQQEASTGQLAKKTVVVAWILLNRPAKSEWLGSASSSSIPQKIMDMAPAYNLTTVIPMLDIDDIAKLPAKGLELGKDAWLMEASKRYQGEAAVIIKLTQTPQQNWDSQWLFKTPNETIAWNFRAKNLNSIFKQGLAKIAGKLEPDVANFAPKINNETLVLTITHINSIEDYSKITRFLQRINSIKEFEVISIKPDQVLYKLVLTSSRSEFMEAMRKNPELQPSADSEDDDALIYRVVS